MPPSISKTTSVALLLLAGSIWTAAPPRPLVAQTVRVSLDSENFRLEPNGRRLAVLNRGTRLEVRARRGRWSQAELEGWIWAPSVRPDDREGFDLVVVADGGENLRREPSASAEIAARLLEGLLLERIEQRGDWIRVRRRAWVWAPSVSPVTGEEPAADGAPASGPAARPSDGGEAAEAPERLVVGGREVGLHLRPGGDTTAVVRPGTGLSVTGREEDWVRVRVEGWVPASRLVPPDSAGVATDLTVADLRASPDDHRGRRVRWTLQFVSLERAEAVRTDFYEGEPFLLTRTRDPSEGFVYLAVPPDLLERSEALRPLQTIRVLARVRTGRSALMGAPVLDLLQIF